METGEYRSLLQAVQQFESPFVGHLGGGLVEFIGAARIGEGMAGVVHMHRDARAIGQGASDNRRYARGQGDA